MNENLKEKIISTVKEKRMSMNDLSKKLFMSERQLVLLLKSWGVEIAETKKRKKIDTPERDVLMKMYNEKGNLSETAKEFNVGVNTIRQWMKEFDIPTRKLLVSDEKKKEILEKHLEKLNNIEL